jgi:glutathione S-transferase
MPYDLILHHYDLSPYAEKIRLCLGRKGLSWRSVQAPMVMPKPDLVELTGGYRRVPVLQLGADIYCDTHLIARILDQVHPETPLSPPGQEIVERALSRYMESSFMMAVLAFFGLGGVFPEEFVEDRKKTMVPPGMDLARTPILLPTKLAQLRAKLDDIERQLGDGRPFLLGAEPCLADFSAFHPVMMLQLHPRTAALLGPLKQVPVWMARVRAVGHGRPSPLDSGEAVAIARDAEPARYEGEPVPPDGLSLGQRVVVLPDEFGSGNVVGELAPSGLHDIAVRRRTERAGEVVVHFPREDYSVVAAG